MATSIDKRTTDMMIARLQGELTSLFNQQESNKAKVASLKAKRGLVVPRKTKAQLNNYEDMLSQNADNFLRYNMSDYYRPENENPYDTTENKTYNQDFMAAKAETQVEPEWGVPHPGLTNFADKVGNMDWSNLAQLAPVFANLGSVLDRNKDLRAKDFYNPYRNQVASLMHNRRVNVNPQLDAILGSERTAYQNLRNMGANNMQAQMAGIANRAMANRSMVLANKQNADLGYMGQEAESMQREGMTQAGINWNVADWNEQSDAVRRNIFRSGLSQLSQWSQNKELMANQQLRDQQLLGIYPDLVNSTVLSNMPGMQDILSKYNIKTRTVNGN